MGDAHAHASVKRCASEPSLHLDEKRPRPLAWPSPQPPPPAASRSSEALSVSAAAASASVSHTHTHRCALPPHLALPSQLRATQQADPRDLLQATLDHICELQRSLQATEHGDDDAHASDYEADDDSDGGLSDSGDECERPWDRQVVLAGFELCSKEALRFLVEEERLGASHPAVRTLSAHLSARSQQLDCRQVLQDYLHRRDPSYLS